MNASVNGYEFRSAVSADMLVEYSVASGILLFPSRSAVSADMHGAVDNKGGIMQMPIFPFVSFVFCKQLVCRDR